jgi:hypothetical protein
VTCTTAALSRDFVSLRVDVYSVLTYQDQRSRSRARIRNSGARTRRLGLLAWTTHHWGGDAYVSVDGLNSFFHSRSQSRRWLLFRNVVNKCGQGQVGACVKP